jgi:hypothetical protein
VSRLQIIEDIDLNPAESSFAEHTKKITAGVCKKQSLAIRELTFGSEQTFAPV